METLTSERNRRWMYRHYQQVDRVVRWLLEQNSDSKSHVYRNADRERVYSLLHEYPDEAIKLIHNCHLSNRDKILKFLGFLKFNAVPIGCIYGDQRSGKDVDACFYLGNLNNRRYFKRRDDFVALGNVKVPPFIDRSQRYFSFLNIPIGGKHKKVYIYCSELELQLPARDFQSQENKLFASLVGTMAQNHQAFMGCAKLSATVDISYMRYLNFKVFKYISPDKLNIQGVERDNILSGLGRFLLPRNAKNKTESLLVFDNNLLKVNIKIPSWYSDDYSEMFKDVSDDMIAEFLDSQYANGWDLNSLRIAVAQKFRRQITVKEIADYLGIDFKNKTYRI